MKPLQAKILTFYIFFICLISITQSQGNKNQKFRCNFDSIKKEPIFANYSSPKNSTYKRILDPVDSDGFKKFNIYLDLVNLEEEIKQYNLTKYRDIFVNGTKNAVNILQSLLKVKPTTGRSNLTNLLQSENISYWNSSILKNVAEIDISTLNFDLIVFAKFEDSSTMGEGTLAYAGARIITPGSGQPLIGVIAINKDIDYSKNNSLRYFTTIILHEMTHVLGFSNDFFEKFFHNTIQKVDSDNITRTYINSSKVLEVARKYFNCSDMIGVQLEDFGGNGTVGSHWEERILLGEYMNGVIYNEDEVISEFTLALLEDTGYYKANYYTGGLMQYGKNKGCEFLNEKCVIDGKVNDKFKNEFFDSIYYNKASNDPSCSSGRQSRAYHYINVYNEGIPEEYQYYQNKNFGGRASCNYCPVSQKSYNEELNSYYTGHCSKLGNGEYGSRIPYNNYKNYYKSGEIMNILSESYSDKSFCVLSSLISKDISNYKQYSNTTRAVCYQMHCSKRSLTIQINNNYLVCPREGGKINGTFFSGYLLCPDYNLICSGTILCNDMYDCVEKKSELKTDILYDYESNTSQDIEDANIYDFSVNAYELSTDGICPQYCAQCNELGHCINCKNDYGIVELKENNTVKRECKPLTELSKGYFKNNEIYYECIENCDKCSNSTECIECSLNHTYVHKKCFKTIEKCVNYDEDGFCIKCQIKNKLSENRDECLNGVENCDQEDDDYNCLKCKNGYREVNQTFCYKIINNCQNYSDGEFCEKCEDGFGFEGNDTLNCKSIREFEEYFSKNDGINYYKCDDVNEGGIGNCRICNNNNTNKELICTECKKNYILMDEENKICYSNETFSNNDSFYYEDSFHLKTCSKSINNCFECSKSFESLKCEKCFDNYFFVNENYSVCYKKEEIIPNDEYFLNESGKQYFSCDNEDYHLIENCKKCTNSTSCNLCKEGFTFIDDNKSECKNISELGNQYIMDIKDYTIYRKCSYYMENCDTCNQTNICLTCMNGFGLYNDGKKCVNDNDNLYYKNSTDGLYYLCNNTLDYCERCSNENICSKCNSDYVLINNLCFGATKNCKEYNDSAKCVECLPGYEIIIDNEEIKCEIEVENCVEVDINGTCTECIKGFRLTNQNLCYKVIENCEIYGDGDFCERCKEGFGFEGNDALNCKSISLFEEYFSKNDGINYYKCDDVNEGGIGNCRICNNNNTNKELICTECKKNYILKDEENKVCYSNETFFNDSSYYYEDSFHIKTCSKSIDNCKECFKDNSNLKCVYCFEDYFIVNNITTICNKSGEIYPPDEFYFDDQMQEYYFCGNKDYHSIKNCKKCTNKTSCNLCKEEFTFIDDNKSECKNITQLGNQFIQDINDDSIYRKCNYYIENCDTCSEADKCLSCLKQYGLYSDRSRCINTGDDEYYKNSTDNTYYYCNNSIKHCQKCSGFNNCKKCVNNYVRLNSNFSTCHNIDEFNHSQYYINPKDENNYIKCSNSIPNCLNCNSSEKCDLCQNGFIFLNDNFKSCHNKSSTNLSKCFTMDNLTYYSCENDNYKNYSQCFTLNPNQVIILIFLQAQMINQTLYCFMLTHSPLPKNFSLILKIHRYNQTVRNLQGQEENDEIKDEDIVLTTKDDSNGTKNRIISFSSEKKFNEDENVKIKELNYNENDKGITNDVVKNNHLTINFDNSSETVDTGVVSKLIQDGKLTEFSSGGADDNTERIINLNLDNINGCEFGLNAGDGSLDSSDENYNFELADYNNNENIINAECSNSQNNLINCKINQNADSEFYFYKSSTMSNSGKYIFLPNGTEHRFKLLCKKNSNKNKFILIAICVGILVVLILLISTRFCCKKKSKKEIKTKESVSRINDNDQIGGSSSENNLIKK